MVMPPSAFRYCLKNDECKKYDIRISSVFAGILIIILRLSILIGLEKRRMIYYLHCR
jgi:hypothetical protein